jgi:uncharacterized membrane protein
LLYVTLATVHVLAAILWIGPPLGAYAFVVHAYRSRDPERILWVERIAERVLFYEHVALVVLLGSGAGFVWLSGGAILVLPWLQRKLALFVPVAIFEAYDIYLAHVVVKRLLDSGVPLDDPGWKSAHRHRRWLAMASVPVTLIFIPGILYSAVAKQ